MNNHFSNEQIVALKTIPGIGLFALGLCPRHSPSGFSLGIRPWGSPSARGFGSFALGVRSPSDEVSNAHQDP